MSHRQAVLRLLDANANRALEGARVCEEVVRFHVESAHAFHRLRSLRHAIAEAIRSLPVSPVERARARASDRDVGRRARASRVGSLEQLVVINLQRVKESLRTLEEVSRLIAPRAVAQFQRLRFRTYEVERELLLQLASLRHR